MKRHAARPPAIALLAAVAGVAALRGAWCTSFVALRLPAGATPTAVKPGASSVPAMVTAHEASQATSLHWPLLGAACCLMAAAVRPRKASGAKPVALVGTTQAPSDAAVQEPRVIMYTRRERLGVGGKVCMLTGKRKKMGFHRSFSEKKNKRYWRPCTFWKKIWWDREQKWVRLYVSAYALKKCDYWGVEHMANRAGLDLYAWCREHWEPGSRQPLPLKVGWTNAAKEAKKYWPQYKKYLNKGKALADIFPAPTFEDGPLCLRKLDVANGGKPLQEGKKPPQPKRCKRLLIGSSAWKAANGV